LRVTAVDAHDGRFEVFDAGSGVQLLDAVGASCAVPGVWPPVSIGGRRYLDGGMRSPANADLAAGYPRVVVVAPMVRGVGPIVAVAAQAEQLRRAGAAVIVLSPDTAARRAIGRNVLDPARRAAAARAGRAQAAADAAAVRQVWAG
jgi:NTE family protein